MKFVVLALLFCLTGITDVLTSNEKDSVTVTLFYECYCPDCQEYVINNLYKAWTTFKGNVLYDLVPFGNARQNYIDGHWVFDCQHGPKECEGNKLHACAIYQACGASGTRNCDVTKLGHVMDFIHCLMTKPDQLRATKTCARNAKLDADNIISCADGDLGDHLLNRYGNQTIAYMKTNYVPTVAINGKHDKKAEEDLVGEICKLLPELCQPFVPEIVSI